MKQLKLTDRATLLNAILRLRLGIWFIITCAILVFVESLPKPLFHKTENLSVSEYSAEISLEDTYIYEPILFNPTDIENGIHIPTGMIADTGCAEVVQNCGACHSLDLVKQNRATKEGWKKTITWMQETQKLWDLGLQEEVILNYLAKNYGPVNSGRRKNLEDIEWYKL